MKLYFMLKDNKSPEQEAPRFLMCPPDFFKVEGPDQNGEFFNDQSKLGWLQYQKDPVGYAALAHRQWHALKDTLEQELDAQITLVTADERLSDQVYTADATLSLLEGDKRYCFISNFTHPHRQKEAHYHLQHLEALHITDLIQMQHCFEGAGDNLYDPFRDVYWSGYTLDRAHPAAGRSDSKAHLDLQQATGITVHSLNVMRPFFHIDTCLSCLSRGHMMVYPSGMSAQSYDTLVREGIFEFGLDPKASIIEVTEQEANAYACNAINIGNKVVLPECGYRVPQILESLGYEVHTVDVSAFLGAGGGPHCLVNLINQQRTFHPRGQ